MPSFLFCYQIIFCGGLAWTKTSLYGKMSVTIYQLRGQYEKNFTVVFVYCNACNNGGM